MNRKLAYRPQAEACATQWHRLQPVILFLFSAIAVYAQIPAADSARGEAVFESQSCNQCHALNGRGAKVGPDLGRLVDRGFTPASLASTLWNHAPTMLGAIRQRNVPSPTMDEQAAADLFAFFYSVRFFEEPGDAGRGKRLFTEQHCDTCHGITEVKNPAAKPTSQWTTVDDPIALIETMWDHASNMRDEMTRMKIAWPVLSGQGAADILVYIRNLPSTTRAPVAFQTVSPENGKPLFDSKGCASCHPSASQFLANGLQGQTMTDVAADMWNHGREMSGAGLNFVPGEMRQIVSYIWSRRMFENNGNAGRGKSAFTKHCASCHGNSAGGAPALTPGAREYSDISMVWAVWKHASVIPDAQGKGRSWPRLDTHDMSDLIAYLNNKASSGAR